MPISINGTTGLTGVAAIDDVSSTELGYLDGLVEPLSTSLASKLDLAGGKILQIVRATDSTDRTTTSTSFVDVTGMEVTITPQKSDSAIIIISTCVISFFSSEQAARCRLTITDNSNNAVSGGRLRDAQVALGSTGSQPIRGTVLFGYSTPATTSPVTYKLRMSVDSNTSLTIQNSTESAGQLYAIEVSA